jgi:hypothetical protein
MGKRFSFIAIRRGDLNFGQSLRQLCGSLQVKVPLDGPATQQWVLLHLATIERWIIEDLKVHGF